MEILCKKCKLKINDKKRLCCILCQGQYHIECTTASKLYNQLSKEKKTSWKCNSCHLQSKKNEDEFHTPPLMNSPPPTFQSPLSSTPQNNINMKVRVTIPTENSYDVLSSEEDYEETEEEENVRCVLQRSCPELNIDNTDEMKATILKLQSELASAEQEIENLLSENYTLMKQNSRQENQIKELKIICTSTVKNNSSMNRKRKSLNFKVNSPNFQRNEQQTMDKTIDTHEQIIIRDETTDNDGEIEKHNVTNIAENPIELRKNKVIILADEQGKGTQFVLQELLGTKYDVFCFCKPGAKITNVLSSCISQINTLTKEDYLVVIGFKNDTNPFEVKYLFTSWLNAVKNTNVLVCENSYNTHLNERKLNNELKFICNQFNSSVFVDLGFSRYVPGRKYYATYLCRNLLREILRMSNHRKYKQFMLAKTVTKLNSDVGTQTDFTVLANREPQLDPEKDVTRPQALSIQSSYKTNEDQFFRL